MKDSDYYPAGAWSDPNAPYNEIEVPEEKFYVTCSQTLSKTVTVVTNNYIPGAEGCDYEPDGEGGYVAYGWKEKDDTSDTNWADEYHANDYHTPSQLLEMFKRYLQEEIEGTDTLNHSPKYLESLMKECDGWIEDETEYIEDE